MFFLYFMSSGYTEFGLTNIIVIPIPVIKNFVWAHMFHENIEKNSIMLSCYQVNIGKCKLSLFLALQKTNIRS